MQLEHINLDQDVLIIAEIGNNHEGDFQLAQELIGLAAETGVQAVKFQTFCPEDYVSASQPERLARLKSFAFSPEQFTTLAAQARRAGLMFLSTPFDLASAAVLDPLVPAFKIASGDNTFYPLLKAVAAYHKPILLSTGLADATQIQYAKSLIESEWARGGAPQDLQLILLHCVSAYPVPADQANLSMISELKQRFGGIVGYSDHTLGIEAAVLATALGARVIEKHFTLAHDYSDFRDHQLSATPSELKELVARIQATGLMLGNPTGWVQPAEAENLAVMRRHLAVNQDLPAGTVVKPQHLTWVRPQGDLAPGDELKVLGTTLKTALKRGEALIPEVLEK